jgi:O-acetyl-ADP-ribose deacetylase
MRKEFSGGRVLRLEIGDITKITVDAMANAANSALAGGGGVDGAIHRGGGPGIMRELDQIRGEQGGCPTGSAVVTSAGKLPARFVFHAVGPVYRGGKHGEPELLASCYRTCLRLAGEHGVKTLSFPSISTGVYGYPLDEAALIAIHTVAEHLKSDSADLLEVIFVLFDRGTYAAYARALAALDGK